MKSNTFSPFNAMWRFLAISFPFYIVGTKVVAVAHNGMIDAPAKRWGLGNSFPILNYVLTPPPIDSKTPNPSSIELVWKCLSLKDP